jgi:histidinol-phosphate aminotransferase
MANLHARLRLVEPYVDEPRERARIDVARSVADIIPYETVSSQRTVSTLDAGQPVFKLDWNESTIAPSPKVSAVLSQYLTSGPGLNWYPTLGSRDLIESLTRYTGCSADYLLATNGSDAALHLICATFLDPGDQVVVPIPTYNHFVVFAESRGAEIVTTRGRSPFEKNLDGIHRSMTRSTRMLYLVSPNNPTGVLYAPSDVSELCECYPDTIILLDEAYYEFARSTGIDLVKSYPNLIVTRTFSKAFGLAGLRVGYLAADPSLIDGLHRLYNPKSVNTMAQLGAIAALDDLDYLDSYLAEVEVSKKILQEFFGSRDIETHATPANFIVIRVDDIARVLEDLRTHHIFVRDRSSYPGLEGCLRMTVGTIEQTAVIIERLEQVFGRPS